MPNFLNIPSKALNLMFAVSNFYEQYSKELLVNSIDFLFEEYLQNKKDAKFTVIESSENLTSIFAGDVSKTLKNDPHKMKVVEYASLSSVISEIGFKKNFTFFSIKNLMNNEILSFSVVSIRGSLELPQICSIFANKYKNIDGIVALGVVKKGRTNHNEYVANEAFRGLNDVSIKYCLPITNSIIVADDDDLILERVSKTGQNLGMYATKTCIEIVRIKKLVQSL